MAALKTNPTELVPLSQQEADQARKSGQSIAEFINGDSRLNLTLAREDGQAMEVSVPAFALRLLAHVLDEMAQGNPVTHTASRRTDHPPGR